MEFIIPQSEISRLSEKVQSRIIKDQLARLKKHNDSLQMRIDAMQKENSDLKKLNKNLASRTNLIFNDINLAKTVKIEMNDLSDLPQSNDDYLKDFFFLLLISEKMKYINYEQIWSLDANFLYEEAVSQDLPFYEWSKFLTHRLEKEKNDIVGKSANSQSIIGKIK